MISPEILLIMLTILGVINGKLMGMTFAVFDKLRVLNVLSVFLVIEIIHQLMGSQVVFSLITWISISFLIGYYHEIQWTNENFELGSDFDGSFLNSILLLVVLLAIFLRIINLDGYGFRIDEIRHFRSAYGYLKTGQFAFWSFQNSITSDSYNRAWLFTWQIYKSFEFLGVNLFSGRIVSLFWGIFMMIPLYFISKEIGCTRFGRILTLIWVTLSPFALSISRWIRMYSIFVTVYFFLILFSLRYLNFESKKNNWFYSFLIIFSGLLSYHFHSITLLYLAGFIVFFILEFWKKSNYSSNTLISYLLTAVVLLGVVSIINLLSLSQFHNYRTLLQELDYGNVYSVYLLYLFGGSMVYEIGGFLLGISLLLLFEGRKERFLVFQLLTPLILLIFFTERFPQMRYVGHLSILAIPIFVRSIEDLSHQIYTNYKISVILLLLLPMIGLVTSFNSAYPYIRAGNMGFLTFPGVNSPKYNEMMKLLQSRVHPGDLVVGYNLPEYYAGILDHDQIKVNWFPRSIEPSGNLPQLDSNYLKQRENRYGRVWFLTLARFNGIEKDLNDYLKNNYRQLLTEGTMLKIYRHPDSMNELNQRN